jgi:hypothetical protein
MALLLCGAGIRENEKRSGAGQRSASLKGKHLSHLRRLSLYAILSLMPSAGYLGHQKPAVFGCYSLCGNGGVPQLQELILYQAANFELGVQHGIGGFHQVRAICEANNRNVLASGNLLGPSCLLGVRFYIVHFEVNA